MNILDIIGPVMVGPSSSHTAGAVRIGIVSKKLLGEDVAHADIHLHGSFWETGKGHGTDKALIAGLLGLAVDDRRIPDSFDLAAQRNLTFNFDHIELIDAHPNTARLNLTGVSGKQLEVTACSLGGGRIRVCEIDGLTANFCGDYPTLIVRNNDQPGHVMAVTAMLGHKGINIATMQLFRESRGGTAAMVIECDQEVPGEGLSWLSKQEGVLKVTYLALA